MQISEGKITIVPTPIGNLGDMTLRSIEVLKEVDSVCAEDTRVTGRLLAALDISKPIERLDENSMSRRASDIAQRAAAGERIAYCSDAGMPGVSDPGLRLVAAARDRGVHVDVLPGASAVDTAYVASGTTCPKFYFGGFFPRKGGDRKRMLDGLRALDAALIFYESPNRLVSALDCLSAELPEREASVCRELTKLHEEVVRGNTKELYETFLQRERSGPIKGEIVIVIDPPSDAEGAPDVESANVRAMELAGQQMRTKDIAKALACEFGIAKNAAYDMAINAAATKAADDA